MLIIDISKTRSTSQRLELDGDGVDYILKVDWSTRYQRFFMEIYDSEKNLLIAGLKLVPGSPLNTGNIDSDGPQGLFVIVGVGDLTRDSFENGGYKLYYFPRSGFVTFPLLSDYLLETDFQEYVEEKAPDPPNLYDGFFVTVAQTGQSISPVITTSSGDISWLWGDGGTTFQDNAPTHNYIDNAESHEVDTYSVAAEDFLTLDLNNCYLSDISLTPFQNVTSITVNSNKLEVLNTNGIEGLDYVNFQDNFVKAYQIEGLQNLVECQGANNSLTDITVKSASSLQILNVAGNDIVTSDFSGGAALLELYVSNNPMEDLDPTYCTSLTTLELANCSVTSLDISQNPLERLVANNNSIPRIDYSNLASCLHFDVRANNIPTIDVDGVLAALDANGLSNGTVDLTDNNSPSPGANMNISSLEGKGWNVYVDQVEVTYNFIVTTSRTSGAETGSTQFKLPLVSGETYNFTVFWGDGTSTQITSYGQASATHTYSTSGSYQIGVSLIGTLGDFAFNGTGDAVKMDSVQDWNSVSISAGMFDGCSNLVVNATDAPTIGTTMERVFKDCSSLVSVPGMEDWDVSNVTNFTSTFEGATLFNQNLLE